ncbi:hypothetical protein BDZ88DRAFT_411239 [Geranomyces variabilis]|nr:hypothetical protein BDZ88DRAFT_411239 [Geranomyces variabilis]KAJ3136621.1 Hematopoietic lineage cell-specific protein [Geranomyces variabilis]
MWKSTVGNQPSQAAQKDNEEDWDTDPDFVNDVGEKDQRWGNQKTGDAPGPAQTDLDLQELRKKVIEENAKRAQDENHIGKSVRESYGVGKSSKGP